METKNTTTKKAAATKRAILKAAGDLFMEKSISKVSVSEIVKKAGVAKGTFYLYYPSKDDVVWEYIDQQFSGANAWIVSVTKLPYTKESMAHIIGRIMAYTKDHWLVLKVMHDVRFHSFLGSKKMEEKYFNKWLIPIEQWLIVGKDSGKLDIDNPSFLAHFILLSIHHMIDRVILDEIPYDLDLLEEQLGIMLYRLLKPIG